MKMEGLLIMSQKEVDRLKVINQIESKVVTIQEGADLIGISSRQTYRVLKKIKKQVNQGIIYKLQGKRSKRGYLDDLFPKK
jgi:transcriptional antiterminator